MGNAPNDRILRWRCQHVGIFWRYLTLRFAFSPTPTPDASQWNIGWVGSQRKILELAMYISCFFCVDFICVWYPTRTPFPMEYWLKHQLSRRRMLFYEKDTSIDHLQIKHCRMHTIRLMYCPILILKVKDRVILDSG